MDKEELIRMNKHLEKMLKLYEESNRDLKRLLALKERQLTIKGSPQTDSNNFLRI